MHFYIVDCFAEDKYQGNQLAVFILSDTIAEDEMQSIAKEVGFSESCFIDPKVRIDGTYRVRIFTPDVELPFAGHPVIGSAFVIDNVLRSKKQSLIRLYLKVGIINVQVSSGIYIMQQGKPIFGEILKKKDVAPILRIQDADINDDLPIQWVSTGLEAIIVPLKSLLALSKCKVNYDKMEQFIREKYKCSILAFTPEKDSIRVRVFMDDEGFFEDAATGSANGDLAAYLVDNGFFNNDEIHFIVKQGFEMGRPSTLYVSATKSKDLDIFVGGKVRLVAEGDWNIG